MTDEDYVLVFEAPKIEPPEFRLYYDEETGKVLFYTCEKPEGKYLVIDSVTFACARQDVRVIDGIEYLRVFKFGTQRDCLVRKDQLRKLSKHEKPT